MSYITIIQDLPEDLQMPMIKLLDAVERDLRDQLAVRREDFDELRAAVIGLTEAQKRTEQKVAELAEAQKRTEERLERLETTVAELAEAQKRTEQRVAELAEAQERTEQKVAELAEAQKRTEERLERLETTVFAKLEIRQNALWRDALERRYRERAYAYLGDVLRRVQVIPLQNLETELETRLSDDEMSDLYLLDVLVRGRLRHRPDTSQVWLAMEVSAVIDRNDVQRAQRRAALLRKAGYPAIPTVVGEQVTQGGEKAAREGHVFLLQDGRKRFWDEALSAVLSADKQNDR